MSYDPLEGRSPYLGMYVDDEDRQEPATALRGGRPRQMSPEPSARASRSQSVPATVLRPSQAPARGVAPRAAAAGRTAVDLPLQRQVPRAVPSPRQQAYQSVPAPVASVARPTSGPLDWLAAFALSLLALVLRLGAILLAVFVVASAVLTDAHRAALVEAMNMTTWLMPRALLGHFVFETPFGGAFRGDLALASLVLFCIDWLCVRSAASLRMRRERGV